MSKNSTITSALGLEEDFSEYLVNLVEKNWKKCETVSDLLLSSASELKFDEFEVSEINLSQYEKKLILLGLVIGEQKKSRDLNANSVEKMLEFYKRFLEDENKNDSI